MVMVRVKVKVMVKVRVMVRVMVMVMVEVKVMVKVRVMVEVRVEVIMIETKKDIDLLVFTAFGFLMLGLFIGFLIGEYNSCDKQGYKYSYDYGCIKE